MSRLNEKNTFEVNVDRPRSINVGTSSDPTLVTVGVVWRSLTVLVKVYQCRRQRRERHFFSVCAFVSWQYSGYMYKTCPSIKFKNELLVLPSLLHVRRRLKLSFVPCLLSCERNGVRNLVFAA